MVKESWNNGSVLAMVDRMFQESVEQYSKSPGEFFEVVEKRFAENLMEFPSLNAKKLAAGQFVRVRCMVQDVRGSEYYPIGYKAEIENCSTARTGFLKDQFDEVDTTHTPFGQTVCRHCYTMVPIPGATPWWIDEWNGDMGADTEEKKARGDAPETTVVKFIAKVSSTGDVDLLPNSTWDMFGYLSKHVHDDDEFSTVPSTNLPELFNLHVISYRSVESTLPPIDTSAASLVRNALLSSLGDDTSAEYLFMNLLSTTYSRPGGMPICSFPLNICGVNNSDNLVAMIKQLMPRVHHLVLTPDLLSKQSFAPIKNYTTDRLEEGLLQLAAGTVLIIDETQLPEGNIPVSDHAENNLKTLERLIVNQQMEYEYGFYKVTFDTDVSMIIVSKKGSRFFRTPFRIAVPPGMSPTVLGSADELAQMRLFIQHRRQALQEMSISQDTIKGIQDAFVEMVAAIDPKKEDKAESLHQMLILCRLISSLDGHSEVTMDSWHRARKLERERNETLKEFVRTSEQEKGAGEVAQ